MSDTHTAEIESPGAAAAIPAVAEPASDATPAPRTPIGRIRKAIRESAELPSLGNAGPKVASMALSANTSLAELAELIVSDPALTQRVLRAANSPAYRTRSGDTVTTVSRAIAVLGYNEARAMAQAEVTIGDLVPREFDAVVRNEFAQAGLKSLLARNLLYSRHPAIAEEGAIAGMFGNIGRVLTAIHAPDALQRIREIADLEEIDENAAARRVLGISFDELTHEALFAWRIPPKITHALRSLPAKPRAPEHANDWLPLAVNCASEIADALSQTSPPVRAMALARVVERFGRAVDIDKDKLESLIEDTSEDAAIIERKTGARDPRASVARFVDAHLRRETRERIKLPEAFVASLSEAGSPSAEPIPPQEKPVDAATRLAQALADIERQFGRTPDIRRLLPAVLTTVQRCMAYERVAWIARDDVAGRFLARLALGVDAAAINRGIAMPVDYAPDLFHAALSHAVDLHIGDIEAPKVASRLPSWFAAAFPRGRSFLILPVRVDDRPLGFIYADRTRVDMVGPTKEELDTLRALRNQVVRALQHQLRSGG